MPSPKVLRIIGSIIGVIAIIIGAFHGYSEIQQGDSQPSSVFINAVGGTECEPNCFPAMTILPTFFIAGFMTIVVSGVMVVWVPFKLKDRSGGIGLVILSILFLLVGGGFLAPILGIVAALMVMFIKQS
jgi:hypothetical protein